MQMFMNIVPALGVLGLLFAAYLAAKVSRQEPGTDPDERDFIRHQ